MWNLLKGILGSGVIIKKFFKTCWYMFLGFIMLSMLFGMGALGLALAVIFGPSLAKRIVTYLKGQYTDIETVPYWGKKFGLGQTIRLLAEDRFHPYVFKNGKICRKLKVSESGRWFSVAGRYYPLHLVKAYFRRDNSLLMVDGKRVKGQNALDDWRVREAIQELLMDHGVYTDNIDESVLKDSCKDAFKDVWGDDYKALGKADWDSVRYSLEKEMKKNLARRASAKVKKKHLRDMADPDVALKTMYSRVLYDDEIEAVCEAINSGTMRMGADWFEMERFENDLAVCNGVSILKNLGYQRSGKYEEFLFNCISDINKPYFEDAVTVLMGFDRKELISLIEKYVAIAHENGDVLFGAGLIYLSGKIGYEISLSREINESKPGSDKNNEFEKLVLARGRM
jgi:hypothetical protein